MRTKYISPRLVQNVGGQEGSSRRMKAPGCGTSPVSLSGRLCGIKTSRMEESTATGCTSTLYTDTWGQIPTITTHSTQFVS